MLQKLAMGLFLINTSHLEDRVWFRDDEDFKAGMNYVPVAAEKVGVKVIVFILMSNHVHFLIRCLGKPLAKTFIDRFKTLYSGYYCNKYKVKAFLENTGETIQEIPAFDESPERAVAYVQMNCVAANICMSPEAYPWGSGDCFFNLSLKTCKRLGDMSGRAQIRLLHSNAKLNQNLEVGEQGYILPRSYVDVKYVEQLYRTPKRMNFFNVNSSKAKALMEKKITDSFSFSDQVLILATAEICRYMYQKQEVSELTRDEQVEVAHTLRQFFRCDAHQIARVLGLNYSEGANILESFH